MELYLKVLEKLELPEKNNLKFLNLERLALKSGIVMKLTFSSDVENQEFILVKTTHKPGPFFTPTYSGVNNVVYPIFVVDHIDAFYAVFKEACVENYQLQNYFELEHIILIIKSFANIHGRFLLNASTTNNEDHFINFVKYLKNHIKNTKEYLNGKNTNINLQLFETNFARILTVLDKTMDKNLWIPSVTTDVNPVFFKCGDDGKPIDFKILVVNSLMYVPPLYDTLMLTFNYITEENRRKYLHEFLQIYYELIRKGLKYTIFDNEQFRFQLINFIPLVKLNKFTFEHNHNKNLQELMEFLQCPRLLREECYEIMANYLGHTEYMLQTFSLTPLQQRYGNLGDYFKLKAKISLNHKMKEVNAFVKFLPSNNETTNAAARNGPFIKEDFFYNFFVKEFKKCGLKECLSFAPKCFLSKTNYVLVLEDLACQGYRLITEQNYFTHDMLKLTVRKLAQLHACSLVFEEIKSKELQKNFRLDQHYGEYLQEIIFQRTENDIMMTMSDVGEDAITNYLIYLYPEVLKKLTMEEFHKRCKLTFEKFYPKVLTSDIYRNTLCHGDTWDTNIMFKFDDNNFPIDCKLVDFQMTRYCPPIQDVMSHLYLTTTRETRTKHLSSLLDGYYEELSKIVTRFGFQMETILSAKEFQNSCHYMKSQAVCQTLLYVQINLSTFEERAAIYSDPEQFEKIMTIDRRPFIEEMMKRHPFYKARIGEWVQDLYDICENEQY